MQAELQAHLAFHLTGKLPQGEDDAFSQSNLHPAILAEYRDLTALRYDFPLVLIGDAAKPVQSLSDLIDGALKQIATDNDGDRIAKHAVRLEREIRKLIAEGVSGTLFELWDSAAARIGAKKDKQLQDSLSRLRAVVKTDGAVADCDQAMPFRLFQHAWQGLQDRKTQAFRTDVNKLIMKLSDILSADFVRSKEGLSADRLRASVGAAHQSAFDFDAMSRVLGEASPEVPMPESRRQRVRALLTALRSQRFFPAGGEGDKWIGVGEPYSFVFETCSDAVAAYRERLPKMVELAKALTMAKLETDGEYSEARHDAFFAEFGANGLDADAIAAFPDYLICLRAADLKAADSELLLQAFVAGMRAKAVLQSDDLLESSPITGEILFSGLRGRQLVGAALSLATSFIVQSSSSSLYRLREQILRGLNYPGPALFSVYSGASGTGLAPYLAAAAAAESRVFPAFSYDPSVGADWASRFSLQANTQSDLDWPLQRLDYEDAAQQLVSEKLAFTFVDFMACDPRCAKHFAQVPRAKWNEDMVPVADLLASKASDLPEKVPCLTMVDSDNRLQKVIVDEKLMREARACLEAWRSLQELGGVHNSHAARLVEQERKAWEAKAQAAAAVSQPANVAVAAATAASAAPATAVPAAPAAAPAVAEAAPERSADDPYIETFRCSSCNECTQINDKMFGYDDNMQASIIDLNAGTYRQLVEAAENCQLSIIHPGKPWNPSEPGLDELVKRAEPFL